MVQYPYRTCLNRHKQKEHTLISEDVAKFLSGGMGRSAKFDTPGDTVRGTILSADVRQQTDFVTKKPKFYDDGNPMEQLVIALQTGLHEDEDDDGVRVVYCKGAKGDPQSSIGALLTAVKQAGATNIAEGGTLVVQFTGLGVPTQGNPPKQWAMAYAAPTPVQTGDLLAQTAPQVAPQAPVQPLQAQPVLQAPVAPQVAPVVPQQAPQALPDPAALLGGL